MTKKAEQFVRRARKMLLEEFGAFETPKTHQLRLVTKAGPLNVTFHDNGDVMTYFDFAIQGEAMVSASVPSGKWNHHSHLTGTVKDAMDYIRSQFERLRPTSLDQFMDVTSIVPCAVVETVLRERKIVDMVYSGKDRLVDPAYMSEDMGRLDFQGNVAWFTRHCEERLVALWDSNPHIRCKLEGDSGLDTVYAFVHHWLDAFIECLPVYRKKHPLWVPLETALTS